MRETNQDAFVTQGTTVSYVLAWRTVSSDIICHLLSDFDGGKLPFAAQKRISIPFYAFCMEFGQRQTKDKKPGILGNKLL